MRVVLTTSAIQTTVGSPDGKSRSRGILEACLAAGHEVFVASTRSRLGEHDGWWAAIVPTNRVFLADEGDTVAAYSAGWKRCLEALEIEWPNETIANRTMPMHWTSVEHWLCGAGVLTYQDREIHKLATKS